MKRTDLVAKILASKELTSKQKSLIIREILLESKNWQQKMMDFIAENSSKELSFN